jgi:hypothetical protein
MWDAWRLSIAAAAVAPVAMAGVLAAVLMAVVIVAIGNAISDQANERDSDKSGSRVNHLAWTPLGVVGGGATDAHAKEENGEGETMERRFHAPV